MRWRHCRHLVLDNYQLSRHLLARLVFYLTGNPCFILLLEKVGEKFALLTTRKSHRHVNRDSMIFDKRFASWLLQVNNHG